jgi:hypothetical protein
MTIRVEINGLEYAQNAMTGYGEVFPQQMMVEDPSSLWMPRFSVHSRVTYELKTSIHGPIHSLHDAPTRQEAERYYHTRIHDASRLDAHLKNFFIFLTPFLKPLPLKSLYLCPLYLCPCSACRASSCHASSCRP